MAFVRVLLVVCGVLSLPAFAQDPRVKPGAPASQARPPNPALARKPAQTALAPRPAESLGSIVDPPLTHQKIPNLNWLSRQVRIRVSQSGGGLFEVRGFLSGRKAPLIWETKGLKITEKKNAQGQLEFHFAWLVPMKGEITPLVLETVDPLGKKIRHSASIQFPQYKQWVERGAGSQNKSRFTFQGGLGTSWNNYTETKVKPFSTTVLTAKGSLNYALIPGKLMVGTTVFATALPLTTNREGVVARYLGINLRAGYLFPLVANRVRFTIWAGEFLTTMMVTDQKFGFTNLIGPQVFPTVTVTLGPKDTVGGYFKFAPLSAGGFSIDLSQREMAGGLSWNHPFGKTWYTLSADYSTISLDIEGIAIRSDSFSVGIGFTW